MFVSGARAPPRGGRAAMPSLSLWLFVAVLAVGVVPLPRTRNCRQVAAADGAPSSTSTSQPGQTAQEDVKQQVPGDQATYNGVPAVQKEPAKKAVLDAQQSALQALKDARQAYNQGVLSDQDIKENFPELGKQLVLQVSATTPGVREAPATTSVAAETTTAKQDVPEATAAKQDVPKATTAKQVVTETTTATPVVPTLESGNATTSPSTTVATSGKGTASCIRVVTKPNGTKVCVVSSATADCVVVWGGCALAGALLTAILIPCVLHCVGFRLVGVKAESVASGFQSLWGTPSAFRSVQSITMRDLPWRYRVGFALVGFLLGLAVAAGLAADVCQAALPMPDSDNVTSAVTSTVASLMNSTVTSVVTKLSV